MRSLTFYLTEGAIMLLCDPLRPTSRHFPPFRQQNTTLATPKTYSPVIHNSLTAASRVRNAQIGKQDSKNQGAAGRKQKSKNPISALWKMFVFESRD